MKFKPDKLIFKPSDVDLSQSPLKDLGWDTFVLGAFNPALTRLPGGNLLMMVRIAEALKTPIRNDAIHAIRWENSGKFTVDAWDLSQVDAGDPRKFHFRGRPSKVMALTSLSWLLPVELSPDGLEVVAVHYGKAIAPARSWQQYGVEDARISKVDGSWFMTTCSVSAERHSTALYTSSDGLNYQLQGIILDHQNKDMLIFEGRVNGKFHALTRPMGELYFTYPPDHEFEAGPSINLAESPDALHWRPVETPCIRPRRGSTSAMKVGGGTPPILTDEGWLLLYHGVEPCTHVGVYRTFWALLDKDDPARILALHDKDPLLESDPNLTEPIRDQLYLTGVVFSTGIAEHGDSYVIASGENDLACRITHIPKSYFFPNS